MTHDEFIVILVTTSSDAEATAIARTLVEERLIACGNVIGPIRSLFRWQGAVDGATEHLLMAKARAADFQRIEERVRALHSYDVPEVIALPIRMGSAPYLAWLADATARGG